MNKWNEKKYTFGPEVGDMIKILTIKDKPKSIITLIERNKPRIYECSYWVRLPHGELIKDLQRSEIGGCSNE